MASSWIGGDGDGGLHERTPYWLNGMVPLVYLLRNANSSLVQPSSSRSIGLQDVPAASCEMGVDMRNHDIIQMTSSSVAACAESCRNTSNCVGYVVDNCTQPVTCWLKYGIGATSNASCRCFAKMPAPSAQPEGLLHQVDRYMGYVLSHQAPSGWLGPDDTTNGDQYWGRFDMLLALAAYAEANPDKMGNISKVMLAFMHESSRRMQSVPMSDWSAARGMDFALSIQWLLRKDPQGDEEFLMDLLAMVRNQTSDWETWFQEFTDPGGAAHGANLAHGVNNAQALKSAAVWYLSDPNPSLLESSMMRLRNMNDYYGMASGMFCADETLCAANERKMPSRGSELCAVVESMFSYNTMFSVHGGVEFADKSERIAFNALPATWASPTGGDIWAHQYLQAVNEISSKITTPHVWAHDGPDAEIYGLEPNYGCCTANFGQGWPKYVRMLIFKSQDNGVGIGAYGPVAAHVDPNVFVNMSTLYPYSDIISITVQANRSLPLYLRVPTWALTAVITVNGSLHPAEAGVMNKLNLAAGTTAIELNLKPQIRLEHWYKVPCRCISCIFFTNSASTNNCCALVDQFNQSMRIKPPSMLTRIPCMLTIRYSQQSVTVHRGALMYSLAIPGNFTTLVTYSFNSKDYQVTPTTEWRYALVVNWTDPGSSFEFHNPGLDNSLVAFNHTNWGSFITAKARVVSNWQLEANSAGPPPASPACQVPGACGDVEDVILAPYGGTDLRISEMPWA
eukprot:TRINITY_DN11863_c0_g1_i7.p1 TRINITY_DN11863_c0_g1~~TRINITY_DN11863_c0_g1_i7.p1  ORF type:complete len:804 (+),score=132.67 TRINITY_DN11863_c0_g1_i7:207-2414(+)